MTSSIPLSSSGSLVRINQNANQSLYLITSYQLVFIAYNTPTAVQSLWSVDICEHKFQPDNDQSGMVHLHRSDELFEYYNRELFSCGGKIEYPYILVRLLANSWVSFSKTAKPDKLQICKSLTFTVGPNYHRFVCRTRPLDCARGYGNVVKPEYFQSPHASTSAWICVMCCYCCVFREVITSISL